MMIRTDRVNIKVGFPFFATASLFLCTGMGYNYLLCMLFSLMHESGHIIAMKTMGCNIKEISLSGMGIKIEKSNSMLSYAQECIVALCGPAVNLIMTLILLFYKTENNFSEISFNINLGLLLINLLPVVMLDGGRFIKYLLLNFLSESDVERILCFIEFVVLIVLICILSAALFYNLATDYFVFFVLCLVGMTVFDMLNHRLIV